MVSVGSRAEQKFVAAIARSGSQYCVEVPGAITRFFGKRGRVPVAVTVNGGFPFNATLMPRGDGGHRLFLNAEARAGASVGDRVKVALCAARADREVPIPTDLASALREEDLLDTWNSFPPGKREHIIKWLDDAVQDATREKRIVKTIEVAHARREKRGSTRQ
jgi:hypothetical protein